MQVQSLWLKAQLTPGHTEAGGMLFALNRGFAGAAGSVWSCGELWHRAWVTLTFCIICSNLNNTKVLSHSSTLNKSTTECVTQATQTQQDKQNSHKPQCWKQNVYSWTKLELTALKDCTFIMGSKRTMTKSCCLSYYNQYSVEHPENSWWLGVTDPIKGSAAQWVPTVSSASR